MNRLASLLPVVALLVAGGCKPEAEPVGAEPVGAAQAEPVGSALAASTEESARSYSPGGATAFGTAACTITEENSGDVDMDGILDNSSVTVTNCETEERNGVMNASFSIVDDLVEAGAATLPFNFTVAGHFDVTATDGVGPDAFTGSVNVDHTVSGNQTSNSIGGSDAGSVAASFEGANASLSSSESYAWDTGYTQTGAVFGDGLLSLNGTWNVELDYHEGESSASVFANSTVQAVGNGLELSSACATHVIGGSLAATYAAGDGENEFDATLTVTWTGCGVSSTTYVDNSSGS